MDRKFISEFYLHLRNMKVWPCNADSVKKLFIKKSFVLIMNTLKNECDDFLLKITSYFKIKSQHTSHLIYG